LNNQPEAEKFLVFCLCPSIVNKSYYNVGMKTIIIMFGANYIAVFDALAQILLS
jgi:hypothetical protein